MHIVARYQDHLLAQEAATYLRSQQIAAGVTGGLLSGHGPFAGAVKGQYLVMVGERVNLARAKALVRALDLARIELSPEWEDEAEPDLSLLDPKLVPPCPACGGVISVVGERCTCCGAEVDLVELVVAEHGPEALADCYPDPSEVWANLSESEQAALDLPLELTTEDWQALEMPCSRCGYALGGLPGRGTCPECGQAYDKFDVFS